MVEDVTDYFYLPCKMQEYTGISMFLAIAVLTTVLQTVSSQL